MILRKPEFQNDEDILSLGAELHGRIKNSVPSVFSPDYWQGRMLDLAMKDSEFKTNLFRFVDVLPSLKISRQISSHVAEYFTDSGGESGGMLGLSIKAASTGILAPVGAIAIRKGVLNLAKRFITGADPSHALKIMRKMHGEGYAFTVDRLGEATVSSSEAVEYRDAYIDIVEKLGADVVNWHDNPLLSRNHQGPIPLANVSIKVSALDSQLDSSDVEACVKRLKQIIMPLLLLAKEKNVFVNFDLEHRELHEITYVLFEEIATGEEFKDYPHLGLVVQAYLKDSEKDLMRLLSLAKSRGMPITVRLVKGAYWDYEVVSARQQSIPCPVFTDKAATDANYEWLTELLLKNIDYLKPAFGTHNHRSFLNAMVTAKKLGIPTDGYEIQMLYGMAEPERSSLRDMGARVRLYAPIGELLPGIGYLVRRLLENTANEGFLRMSYHDLLDKISFLRLRFLLKKSKRLQ